MNNTQTGEPIEYKALFESFEKGLNGQACSYVHGIRKNAFADFTKQGFPTSRLEDWKYVKSNILEQISKKPYFGKQTFVCEEIKNSILDIQKSIDAYHLVLLNGYFAPELSSLLQIPKGVVIGSLAHGFVSHPKSIQQHLGKVVKEGSGLFLLNTAFVLDGVFIYLPKGVKIKKPIYVTRISNQKSSCFSRILVVGEQQSQMELVENCLLDSPEVGFNNHVTEIALGQNAKCEHLLKYRFHDDVCAVNHVLVNQGADSFYKLHNLNFASKMSRNEVLVSLNGKGAECQLTALSFAVEQNQAEDVISVHHVSPFCSSQQLYKGIFSDSAVGSFYGKIKVEPDAIKTNATQISRSLLLSSEASCHARPQLEIDTDDVKCSHGSTVGQLDENALFYLRARGIKRDAAENMLTLAFAKEALENIGIKVVQQKLEKEVEEWLSLKERRS